jgi:hypothetical protein
MKARAKGRRSALVATESEEQHSLFLWAKAMERQIPELTMLFAIPNAGAARGRLRLEGVKKGIPDLMLAVSIGENGKCAAGRIWHGLFIEMKRRKGGAVKLEQTAWLNALTEQDYRAVVCYGWDEAREQILKYLGRES